MTKPIEEWQLKTHCLGRRVIVYDRLESTNAQIASLADDPSHDGLVVLAREQTAGRGQHGRSWHCPAGAGVLLSVLLYPPPVLRRPALLTAWAAVSVCETIRIATGLQAKIKWPNDVLLHGRKVCGILIEQGRATVCGIGLNLNQTAEVFLEQGLVEAASLAMVTGRPLDWDATARLLIGQLDEEYDRICEGDLHTLESCWTWRLGLLGKQVVAECHDRSHEGRLIELGWDGVVLDRSDGTMRLPPEAVRHLRLRVASAHSLEE
jgi:BirA family biotin operon repressor/biotin-[acetyl-CoA-carboxylase] ligase